MQVKSVRAEFVVDNKLVLVEIVLRDQYAPKSVPSVVLSKDGQKYSATSVTVTHSS